MQRDPGAGSPIRIGAGGAAPVGQFIPRDQYADGMNLYEYVSSSPVNWVDTDGHKKGRPGVPPAPPPGTGPAKEQPAGPGATCGIKVYRSAICTLTPKKASDFGHEWITDGATTWDYPKNYFKDPIQPHHKWDKEHPMWTWNAHVSLFGGKLPDGTPCEKATCSQIKSCLQNAENEWAGTRYRFFGHTCIDFAGFALGKCCMAKGVVPIRVPKPFEELRACCERQKQMNRLGHNPTGGP